MKVSMPGLFSAAGAVVVFAAACTSSGAGGREVVIMQKDDGCTPASVSVTPGEKLNLKITNESNQDAYEVEGIDGTNLTELLVPKGKTRSVGYDVPGGAGVRKIKCYVPTGPTTIIELTAGGASVANPTAPSNVQPTRSGTTPVAAPTTEGGGTTVAVSLMEYAITPDKTTVKAGSVRFIATNISSSQIHELVILKFREDGSLDTAGVGEIEDISPQQGGSVQVDLAPGAYKLACLIAAGEAGSTVDHYQQGMQTDFTVTP